MVAFKSTAEEVFICMVRYQRISFRDPKVRSALHVFMIDFRTEKVKNITEMVDEGVLSSKLDHLYVILHNFFHLEHRLF